MREVYQPALQLCPPLPTPNGGCTKLSVEGMNKYELPRSMAGPGVSLGSSALSLRGYIYAFSSFCLPWMLGTGG